jgi:hypothetical protein
MSRLLSPGLAAKVGFAMIAVLGLLGVITVVYPGFCFGMFSLDGEFHPIAFFNGGARVVDENSFPVYFSSALLAAGMLASISVGRLDAARSARWLAFAFVLGEMSLDEAFEIHERLEALAGIDWQILYIPLVLLAAATWWFVVGNSEQRGRLCLALGAAAWMASQVFEHFEWLPGNVKAPYYGAMMVSEELLEMSGSLVFLIALLLNRSELLTATLATGAAAFSDRPIEATPRSIRSSAAIHRGAERSAASPAPTAPSRYPDAAVGDHPEEVPQRRSGNGNR